MVIPSELHPSVFVDEGKELLNDGESVFDRLTRMRRLNQGCDVFFQLGDDRVSFAAHRVILASASEVFHTSFYGSLQSRDGHSPDSPTHIPDVTPEAFEALLQFCYSAQRSPCLKIRDDIVVHVLYAAEKYDVRVLKDACLSHLEKLTLDNCFVVLRQALHYGDASLIERCMRVIDANSDAVLRSHALQHCNRKELAFIIGGDTFAPSSELHIFKELLHFGRQKLNREEAAGCGRSLREAIGELLMLVRFPLMPVEDLLQVARENVLTDDELGELFHYKADERHHLRLFSARDRRGGGHLNHRSNDSLARRTGEDFYCVRRIAPTEQVDWLSIGSSLFFEASAAVSLIGFAIYGFSDGKGTLDQGDVTVMFGPYGGSVQQLPVKGVCSDDLLVHVFVDDPPLLVASNKYFLCVNLCNADGRMLRRNVASVEKSTVEVCGVGSVRFEFDAFGGNGFFPELYFRCAPSDVVIASLTDV